jgi:hypothetical protein
MQSAKDLTYHQDLGLEPTSMLEKPKHFDTRLLVLLPGVYRIIFQQNHEPAHIHKQGGSRKSG